jgi:hypothetical protein
MATLLSPSQRWRVAQSVFVSHVCFRDSSQIGVGFYMAGNVFMGRKPYARMRPHMLDEFFQDTHAGTMPDDMRMHGEEK